MSTTQAGTARTQIILRHASLAVLLKGAAFFITMAILPVYLEFFRNAELLGFWLAALSMVNWILTLDFGIGNGMRNDVVRHLATGDRYEIRGAVVGAYVASLVLASAMGAIILGIALLARIAGIHREGILATAEGISLVVWLTATVLVQFILRTINFVFYAMQRSVWPSVLSLSTSLLLLLGLWISTASPSRSPEWIGPIYMLSVNLPLVLATSALAWQHRGDLRTLKISELWSTAPSAWRSGRGFFVNQLLFTAFSGTSVAMVAAIGGPESVVSYQAHFTLFSIAGILATLALTPAWSMVTKAFAEHDYDWIMRTFRHTELFALALCVIPMCITAIVGPAIAIWLGPGVVSTTAWSSVAFLAYSIGLILHSVSATFAAGTGKLRLQRAFYLSGFLAKIIVCVTLVGASHWWPIIPAVDAVVLVAYFAVERKRIRGWVSGLAARTGDMNTIGKAEDSRGKYV